MAAKPRRRKNEKPVVVVDENGLSRIAFSPSFIKWAIGEGQTFAADLGYAPLPDAVVTKETGALEKIKVS